MKLFDYLACTPETLEDYVAARKVDRAHHPEFPLALLCYGRKTVYDNLWDSVTTKCRGLIYNTETLEIVARPFEKFFNWGQTYPDGDGVYSKWGEPEIYEKLDGFLCILYQYAGQDYIASKGSFTSPHAKWATAWLQKHYKHYNLPARPWPAGFTPVFEGITKNLRIVVDYGEAEELRLIGLVNNETGEESTKQSYICAGLTYLKAPQFYNCTMADALENANKDTKNFEGYVLVWRRPGQTPFRLKVKLLEYLRLHRFVTQVSPKRILEAMENGWDSVLAEYVETSPIWFANYVKKWRNYIDTKFKELAARTDVEFEKARRELAAPPFGQELPTRKQWAERFTTAENKDISAALFATLDGNTAQTRAIIWKKVREEVKNGRPLVDAHL